MKNKNVNFFLKFKLVGPLNDCVEVSEGSIYYNKSYYTENIVFTEKRQWQICKKHTQELYNLENMKVLER